MASIPAGSLAFTGFGDGNNGGSGAAGMRFLSSSGVDVGQPDSAPNEVGSGANGLVILAGTNRWATTGGNAPNFPLTGTGVFNSNGTFRAEQPAVAGNSALDVDDAGYFYGGYATGVSNQLLIYKYDGDAALINTWTITTGLVTVPNVYAIAVNRAATIAYVHTFDSTVIPQTAATVYKVSLAGAGAWVGVFASEPCGPSNYLLSVACLRCMSNGDLVVAWRRAAVYAKRYNTSGTLQATYTITDMETPQMVVRGYTDSTFWLSGYGNALATYSATRVVEIQLSDGSLLHNFTPEDDQFEFDGPFAVLGTSTGPTISGSDATSVDCPLDFRGVGYSDKSADPAVAHNHPKSNVPTGGGRH